MLTAILIMWRITIWSLVAALAITAVSIAMCVFVLVGVYGLVHPRRTVRGALGTAVANAEEAGAMIRALRPS